MRNFLYITLIAVFSTLLASCGKSPEKYAEESRELHEQLSKCSNREDSIALYGKIITLESQARNALNKTEFKEYARLAHPNRQDSK